MSAAEVERFFYLDDADRNLIARRDEAVARLSPLGHAHSTAWGRYAFTAQPPAELRPLRDPNARDGEDDGEF